jgi:hypothetical protein
MLSMKIQAIQRCHRRLSLLSTQTDLHPEEQEP